MILSDHDIRKAIFDGKIEVAPFDESLLQPASLDVRLDCKFARICPDVSGDYEVEKAVWLEPGQFLLGATFEYISLPNDIVARLEGKSTLGRQGLIVHATAGYIDPGFRGFITLELSTYSPIHLRVFEPVAQLSFHRLSSPSSGYKGKYQDAPAGPTRARSS